MPQIYVDADACPVRGEVERVAGRHGLEIYMVSNGGIRPSREPHIHVVIVAQGADAADNWIAEHAGPGDVVITADIPLAARCLERGAWVVRPTGRILDGANIGMALATREIRQHLREVSGQESFNKGFATADRSRFLQALENAIQAAKRS